MDGSIESGVSVKVEKAGRKAQDGRYVWWAEPGRCPLHNRQPFYVFGDEVVGVNLH
jgi:hypothetical protein